MKRYLTLLFALLAALALTVSALAAEEDDGEETVAAETVETVSDPSAPHDNDELFYQYMLQLGRESVAVAQNQPQDGYNHFSTPALGIRLPTQVETAGSQLTGKDKLVYDYLKAEIAKVARGERTSTTFSISVRDFLGTTDHSWNYSAFTFSSGALTPEQKAEEACGQIFSYDHRAIVDALLADMPYELFWYNKTAGYSYGSDPYYYNDTSFYFDSSDAAAVVFKFSVAREYGGSYTNDSAASYQHNYEIDAGCFDSNKVSTAVSVAAGIVASHASKTDYEKLVAYKNAICDAVSYNSDALETSNTVNNKPAFTNPWQLIWAFDNDSTTSIVCEGYSKAFKYLCDLSTFEGDVQCYIVTGYMAGGTGAGGHMWNIVTLEDKNYHVDVTNCDEGSIGYSDSLFLKGVTVSPTSGVPTYGGKKPDFAVTIVTQTIYYWYDSSLAWKTSKPEILSLCTTDYAPAAYTLVAGGDYSYYVDGTTLHLQLESGAKVIVACYTGGQMTKVQMTDSTVTVTLSGDDWKIFSVTDAFVPKCAAVSKPAA